VERMREEKIQIGIKPVGTIKLTKASKAHIPKLIRRETETRLHGEIPFVTGSSIVLLYDPRLSLEELLERLKVLEQDLKLRVVKTPQARTGGELEGVSTSPGGGDAQDR
jgi:hypothetical protein